LQLPGFEMGLCKFREFFFDLKQFVLKYEFNAPVILLDEVS